MKLLVQICGVVLALLPPTAFAAEVSLLSGGLQTSTVKVASKEQGSMQSFELGGRYYQNLTKTSGWYALGGLQMVTFSAGQGFEGPSDFFGIQLGGGLRQYYPEWSEGFEPYIAAQAQFEQRKTGSPVHAREASGIYYSALLGLRIGLDRQFFIELETPMFEHGLMTTETTESTVAEGSPDNETETTGFELRADSSAPFHEMTVGLGMVL